VERGEGQNAQSKLNVRLLAPWIEGFRILGFAERVSGLSALHFPVVEVLFECIKIAECKLRKETHFVRCSRLYTYLHLNNTISYHFYSVSETTMFIPRKSNIQYSDTVCSTSWLDPTAPVLCIVSGPQLVFYSSLDLSSAYPGGPVSETLGNLRETCNVIEGLELQMCNSTSGSESCIFVRFHVIDH